MVVPAAASCPRKFRLALFIVHFAVILTAVNGAPYELESLISLPYNVSEFAALAMKSSETQQFQGKLYFNFYNGNQENGPGNELYVTDGTPEGTGFFYDTDPLAHDSPSYRPRYLTNIDDNVLLFIGSRRQSIFAYDGEEIEEITLTGFPDLDAPLKLVPQQKVAVTLTFSYDEVTGSMSDLWKTDGTLSGTEKFASFCLYCNEDEEGFFPEQTTPWFAAASQDKIYFAMKKRGPSGSYDYGIRAIWSSDLTAAGTAYWKEFSDRVSEDAYDPILAFRGHLLVVGLQGLWSTSLDDSTNPFEMILEFGDDRYLSKIIEYHDRLYFCYQNDVWSTDGTQSGTTRFVALQDHQEECAALQVAGDKLFIFRRGTDGLMVWDGTPDEHVTDLGNSCVPFSYGTGVALGNALFFPGTHERDWMGVELCTSDGTVEGTGLVADINPTDAFPPGNRGLASSGLFDKGKLQGLDNDQAAMLLFFAFDGSDTHLYKIAVVNKDEENDEDSVGEDGKGNGYEKSDSENGAGDASELAKSAGNDDKNTDLIVGVVIAGFVVCILAVVLAIHLLKSSDGRRAKDENTASNEHKSKDVECAK